MCLRNVAGRLAGYELDPFAAWFSHVLLEVTMLDTCTAAGLRLPSMVQVCDSLEQEPDSRGFDLVVGNPPYGRITLRRDLRTRYQRSLYGHANLYGLFTDLALRHARIGGVIAYVTPTSFLAGEYFKALRGLLASDAPPATIDFVPERRGVFEGVQQETVLAAYRRGGDIRAARASISSPRDARRVTTRSAGSFRLPNDSRGPWLVPRSAEDGPLVRGMRRLTSRLADYGYTVSTGPLVWNRYKQLLCDRPGQGRYPLIWAESVRPDGRFEFRAEKRNHKPYFAPRRSEQWVLITQPCVLLQRTTAKEQHRRLIAAELPGAFIAEYGAAVVENHLNMIRPIDQTAAVPPDVLARLLTSDIVDRAFRCINGSVAISAYELEAFPLPGPADMAEIKRLVRCGARPNTIERKLERIYTTS